MIKRIANVTLKSKPANKDNVVYSTVFIDDQQTSVCILGYKLEAALSFADELIILFVTDDIISETSLHIYLINPRQRKIIDKASISKMYYTGIFSNLKIIDENNLYFEFMTDLGWLMELFNPPKKTIPIDVQNFGIVHRPFSFSQYFTITPVIPTTLCECC